MKEFQIPLVSGMSVYGSLIDASSRRWNNSTSSFEVLNTANWSSYTQPVVDDGTGLYYASMPAGVAAGRYGLVIRNQTGAAPNSSDTIIDVYYIDWSGTSPVSLDGLAAAVWSAATRTLTTVADSAGVTTLLSRIVQSILFDGSGNVKSAPQTSVSLSATDEAHLAASDSQSATAATQSTTIAGQVSTLLTRVNQVLPPNLSSMSIDSSGRVLLQPSEPGLVVPDVTNVHNLPSPTPPGYGSTTLILQLGSH